MNADTFPFEQGDGIHASVGEKLIDDAGGEEIDIGRARCNSVCASVGHLVSII
jgi:hypothetical protein